MGVGCIGMTLVTGNTVPPQLPAVKELIPFIDYGYKFLLPPLEIFLAKLIRRGP
jgi:hypothetical protein